jgi:hypothetical protein
MKSVYILFHTHHFEDGEDDDKLIGVYSSRELAERKIEGKYKKLPGFCDADGEFIIDEYEIDLDHWEEGYLTEQPKKKTSNQKMHLTKNPSDDLPAL